MKSKPKIGVMGSAGNSLRDDQTDVALSLAKSLGVAIAEQNCVLITGETTGLPGSVAEVARQAGAMTVGISPAHSEEEHTQLYSKPDPGSEVVVYTGFGLKGRNVVNIRSSDIVIIICGSVGTLNEFTIAYDEGKVIGILEGSGGIADEIARLIQVLQKTTKAVLIYNRDPAKLLDRCLSELKKRKIKSR